MPFDTIDQGLLALQKHMHHKCRADDSFYLPLLGKRFSSSEATTEDLETAIMEFTADTNPKRVCALFGDGGSGKSFFLKQFTLKFLNEYSPEKPIPLFVSLPLLKDPIHSVIEETLLKIGFDETQIAELKTNHSFIFILDGYDEIHQLQNLYVSNGLSEWNAKTIISCRSQYLYNKEHTNLYFMPIENEREQPHLLQTLYVAPFNQDQIRHYFELSRTNNVNIPDDDAIEMIPGLQDLITSPFLLKLVEEALPEIFARYANASQQERQQLTQTELYRIFVKQWFERQEKKLIDSGHITADMPDQKSIFWRYCQSLALEMHKRNLSWLGVDDERFSVYFENDAETEILRSACPIKKTENKIGFWHESLGMYFVAQTIYQESLANSDVVEQQMLEMGGLEQERPQGAIHLRLITDDPVILSSMADEVDREPKYKAGLFDIIERSKTNANYIIGAANAISVLNAAKISFSGKDLKGVRIPYANLTEAFMPGADLSYSDLSGVNFTNAVLVCANLYASQVRDVNFSRDYNNDDKAKLSALGRKRSLAFDNQVYDIDFIAYSEENKIMIISLSDNRMIHSVIQKNKIESMTWLGGKLVSGGDNGEIWIWNVGDNMSCAQILHGHVDCITDVTWSPDGKLLASGSKDKTIRIWDTQVFDCLKVMVGHTDSVTNISFSNDSKMLASSSYDSTVRLWDIRFSVKQDGLKKFTEHAGPVMSVIWSPDGKLLASAGFDKIIYVRRVDVLINDTYILQMFSGHKQAINSIIWTSDSRWIISSNKNEFFFWDTLQWGAEPIVFPFGVENIKVKNNFLLITYALGISILNLEDFPNKLYWMSTGVSYFLWLNGCNIRNAQGLSFKVKQFLEDENVVSEEVSTNLTFATLFSGIKTKVVEVIKQSQVKMEKEGTSSLFLEGINTYKSVIDKKILDEEAGKSLLAALGFFNKILIQDSRNQAALFYKAVILFMLNDFGEAEALLDFLSYIIKNEPATMNFLEHGILCENERSRIELGNFFKKFKSSNFWCNNYYEKLNESIDKGVSYNAKI